MKMISGKFPEMIPLNSIDNAVGRLRIRNRFQPEEN
jgi:hypothetical protein